ncbi:RsiV family protein [Pedobacter sp. NJ-S-72]
MAKARRKEFQSSIYKVQPDSSLTTILFEDHLAANKNFFFDKTGISFLYNPYEVASFAQGQIIVSVPYKDLKKYLNPAFVKRMEY